jgi:hypothetical protein
MSNTVIKSFESFSDGSGATATIETSFGGVYVLNVLGTPRLTTCLRAPRNPYAGRMPAKRAEEAYKALRDRSLDEAFEAYSAKLNELGPEWMEKNLDMYEDA